jgi:hypothetical protein
MPTTPSFWDAADRGDIAWTVVPGPCPGVARAWLGTPDVDRLWELLAPMLRLDAPDPASAWREHIARLRDRAALLQERSFSALRFRGGGHGPDRRSPGRCPVGECRGGNSLGCADRGQHAHRGGVYHAGPQTHRGCRAHKPAHPSRSRRRPGRGPDPPLRARPGRAHRRHPRRRSCACSDGHRRRRSAPRRGCAG